MQASTCMHFLEIRANTRLRTACKNLKWREYKLVVQLATPPVVTTNAPRHSTRIRKPTILHTAPEFITKSTPKGGKSKKRKIKKEEVAVEKKGRKVISKKAIKAKTEKIKQKKKILLDAITNLEAPEKGAQGIKPEKSMINARTRHGDTALALAVRYQ
ncbi:hypothetical protein OSTOST_13175, partial [Ostertagia ostertagi]